MRQRLLILLSLLFGGAGAARAQVYEPGLLVRSSGDTLRGEVENAFWGEPPAFIRFRRGPGAASELFLPRQLRAVSLTGGRYFRYEALPIDHAAEVRLDQLPARGYTNVQVDTLLAEVLIDGPATLLRVGRPSVVHYLVQRAGQPWLDLSERYYLSESTTGANIATNGNNYRGQLGLYFSSCPEAFAAAQAVPFTPAGLARVVQAYNAACSPARQAGRSWLAAAKGRRRVAFQGGVLAGLRYNHIESPASQLAGTSTDGLPHPFGGFYAELLQPSRTAAVFGELTLSGFRSRSLQASYPSASSGQPVYTPFDYQALLATARIGVRYLVPLAHDHHLLFSFGFEHNETLRYRPDYPAGSNTLPSQPDEAYAQPTLLPNFGVGWRTQRITLGLDGQLYANRSGDGGIGELFIGHNVAVRLGVGYRLGRHPDAKPLAASSPQ